MTTIPTRCGALLLMGLAAWLLATAPAASAGTLGGVLVEPGLNDGRKWRIGYYQGGPYGNYRESMLAIARGLEQLGWLKAGEPPEGHPEDAAQIWRWLSESVQSDFLEFVPDAYHDARWEDARRAEIRAGLLQRLSESRDLDLVIAMGTWAGRDLASDAHDTPTVVVSTSDAVKAGIITSVEDSGRAHVHAHVDPTRFARQIRTFHDTVGFRRLGVVYRDSVEGRSYSGIALAEQVANERGFEIVRCRLRGDFRDEGRVEPTVVACFELLAGDVDALYVVSQTGLNDRTLPRLVKIATEAGVATFAQHGATDVRGGMLMSMSRKDFDGVGMFQANVVASIFNGAAPRSLEQKFEEESRITLNVETAALIGFTPSPTLLNAADIVGEDPRVEHAERSENRREAPEFLVWLTRRSGQ